MATPTVPSRRPLAHTLRLPSQSATVRKTLGRLNYQSLVSLALDWLSDDNIRYCEPVTVESRETRRRDNAIRRKRKFGSLDGAAGLDGDGDGDVDDDTFVDRSSDDVLEEDVAPYDTAVNVDEVRDVYVVLGARAGGGGKKEVLDRILEGDWRDGLSLYQLAMAETRFVMENSQSVRWHGMQFERIVRESGGSVRGGRAERNDGDNDGDGDDDGGETASTASSGHLTSTRTTRLTDHRHDSARVSGLSLNIATRTSSFLATLHQRLSALVRAHYYVIWHPHDRPVSVLRLHLRDSPYATERAARDSRAVTNPKGGNRPGGGGGGASGDHSWKTVFFVFPDDTPYVYVGTLSTGFIGSSSSATAGNPLMKLLVDAIPAALSRPHARLQLRPTSLSCRSLDMMLKIRGPGRGGTGHAGGVWSQLVPDDLSADGVERGGYVGPTNGHFEPALEWRRREVEPLGVVEAERRTGPFLTTALSGGSERIESDREKAEKKRWMDGAKARFGHARPTLDGVGIDQFDVCIQDSLDRRVHHRAGEGSGTDMACPSVSLSFRGSDVFGGVRTLVEMGVVDAKTMPGWMTGVGCVSRGTVRDGSLAVPGS